jgi:uncharacterized membrane protein
MNRKRKIGIVLILLGFCLPLVSFNYADGYKQNLGLIGNIVGVQPPPERPSFNIGHKFLGEEKYKRELREYQYKPMYIVIFGQTILYKNVVALGIVLIFIGVGFVFLSRHD